MTTHNDEHPPPLPGTIYHPYAYPVSRTIIYVGVPPPATAPSSHASPVVLLPPAGIQTTPEKK